MKITSFRSPRLRHVVAGLFLLSVATRAAFADPVTDWNAALESTLIMPPTTPNERGPAVPARTYAILHAAMFDAVNGVSRRFEPLHVTELAPPGARAEAAAIQAAYTVLTALRPGNQAVWDAQLATSLAELPGSRGNSQSIAHGRAWGTTVANAILAWRTGDVGTVPSTVPGPTTVGYWQFTPDPRPFAGRAAFVTAPFVLSDPAAFDPGPPYGYADRADALASASYAADVAEVEARGGATSTVRTAEEEYEALFLHAADQASLNQLLRSLVSPHARLVDNARVFALMNGAYHDATIALFQAKYAHQLWRPFQAVNNADLDNNAATTKPGTTWAPLRGTPPHPEYPSAHVTLFTSMLRVMSRLVGDLHAVDFYAPGYASPLTYESLEAISDASVDARVDIGYHFRETGEISQIIGRAIADHLVDSAMRPLRAGRKHNKFICDGGWHHKR